jgi:hypothetical protein
MTPAIAARKVKLHDLKRHPCYGMVLNGSEFLFLKLSIGSTPQYATSNVLSLLNRGNDLYEVLQILRGLRQCIMQHVPPEPMSL